MGTPDQTRIFDRYFDLVPREAFRPDLIALDAGCGGGRWAYQLASRGPRVIAIDLGLSVEVAEQNTRSTGRVACVQADLLDLPIRRGAIDLAYSLGVLHHIGDTAAAIAGLAGTLRPDGLLLAYLYYALDGRSLPYRALFVLADLLRRAISRLPHPAVLVMATAIAAGTYLPVARTARLLRRLGLGGLADRLPLSFYADLSFGTMLNDSLDRFGTTVEKRYSRAEIAGLLAEAGITLLRIADAPPYWRVLGRTRGA